MIAPRFQSLLARVAAAACSTLALAGQAPPAQDQGSTAPPTPGRSDPAAPARDVARGSAPARDDARGSIEQLILELRARRQAVQEALRPAVDALWARLLALPKPASAAALEAELAALQALGAEAVPLYVARLDPPAQSGEETQFAARQLASAVAGMDADTALHELLSLAQGGSIAGRSNAARALGASRSHELVVPVLEQLVREGPGADGALRREALESLARLGPAAASAIERLLAEPSKELLRAALDALGRVRSAEAAPAVARLLAGPSAAACVSELVAYYAAVPEVFTREVLASMLALACSPALKPDERARLLEHAATCDVGWESALRGELASLVQGGDFQARVDALVCLARLGDTKSKRDLERDLDEIVAKQERWPPAYVQRADVEVRLGELEAALKDYRRALELNDDDGRSDRDMSAAHTGEARVLCLQNKLKEASEALKRSPLTDKQLRALASDRDFAGLASHPKFGAVLGGPPDAAPSSR